MAGAFNLKETDVKDSSRVCSKHFPNEDTTELPSLHLGKCFASPKKRSSGRSKRASKRQKLFVPISPRPATNRVATSVGDTSDRSRSTTPVSAATPMWASIGEPLLSKTDYGIHELPTATESNDFSTNYTSHNVSSEQRASQSSGIQVTVNAALLSQVEALERETEALKKQLTVNVSRFSIEDINTNDDSICFYTGFASYEILLCFF